MMLKSGTRIHVDYISESRTEFSGKRFFGDGTIDLVEDGYVYGRLDNGLPFLCMENDVRAIPLAPCFETWLKAQENDYKVLIFRHGDQLFIRRDGEYEILSVRLAHKAFVRGLNGI